MHVVKKFDSTKDPDVIDFFGEEILIGDIITYIPSNKRSRYFHVGFVTSHFNTGKGHKLRIKTANKKSRWGYSKDTGKYECKDTQYFVTEHVLIENGRAIDVIIVRNPAFNIDNRAVADCLMVMDELLERKFLPRISPRYM